MRSPGLDDRTVCSHNAIFHRHHIQGYDRRPMIIPLPGYSVLRILHTDDRFDRDWGAPDDIYHDRPSEEVRPGMEEYPRTLVLFAESLNDAIFGNLILRPARDGLEGRVDGVVVDRHARILPVVLRPGGRNIVTVGPLYKFRVREDESAHCDESSNALVQ